MYVLRGREGEREREREQARDSFCTYMYIHPDIHTQQCVYIIYTHNYESTVNINTNQYGYKHTDVFAVFVSYRTISICMTRYRMHLYMHKTFSLQPRSSDFEA